VAAFFAEPVMGAGGVIVRRGPISRRSLAVCAKHDVFISATR